jgi:hypothetical protein
MDRARAGRAGVVALALTALLAVVALTSRQTSPLGRRVEPGGGPSRTFFDTAFTLVLLLEALCFAIFLYALWTFRHERWQRRRRSWLRSYFLVLAVMLLISVFGLRAIQHGKPRLRHATGGQTPAQKQLDRLKRQTQGKKGYDPRFNWIVALIVGGGIGGAAVTLIVLRRRRDRDVVESAELPEEAVADAVGDAIDDLRREPDPRRAIVAAYARMERSLASHGFARRRWEAPLEYLSRVLLELRAGAEPVRRLTELFEQAKFARAEPPPQAKDEAIDSLVRIRNELRGAV